MESTPDNEKLSDLVANSATEETFIGLRDPLLNESHQTADVTPENYTTDKNLNNALSLTGVTDDADPVNVPILTQSTVPVVMPENVSNLNITQNSVMLEIPPPQSTQELVGHNTTTTTDEEEAAKALIALATCQP